MKNIRSNFLPVATIMCFVLAACASTPSAKRVSELGATALIGSWISELDDTKLTVEKNGVYRIEHAADADAAGEMHVLADLRARAHGGPGVDHGAFINVGADVDVGRHEHHVLGDVRTTTGGGWRYHAEAVCSESKV